MRNQALFSRQLEYFMFLYRARNYAVAARSIPITYQGLRKAIAKLEMEVGIELFETEEGENLHPTKAADMLYEQALKWTADLIELDENIHAGGKKNIRTVFICAPLGCCSALGHGIFLRFSDLHPDLRLDITELPDDIADDSLLRGEFGVGFTASPFDENLYTTPIKSMRSLAWVNKDDPLAEKNELCLRDFEDRSILSADSRFKEYRYLKNAFSEQGIHVQSKGKSPDPSWSQTFAEEGRGIGITQECAIRLHTESSRAVLLPIRDGYVRSIALSHRRGHILTSAEQVVWDYFIWVFSQNAHPGFQL